MGIYQPIARGTVTQANMKISASAGTAFFDFGVNTIKIGSLLKIRDSVGRAIQGYVKAAGTGETLSATNLVTGWTNVDYTTFETTGADITDAEISSGTKTGTSNTITTVAGKIYKLVATWTNDTGQAPTLTGTGGFKTTTLSAGANNIYFTATGTSAVITVTNSAAAHWAATFVLKQLTIPSATGFTISSTKGGVAMDNWAQKDAAFNYNDASGYTYEVYKVLNVVVPDSRIHNVYTSNHSAGVDGWTTTANSTIAGNIDSIGGEDNWVRTTSAVAAMLTSLSNRTLVAGRKYTLIFKYYNPAANTTLKSIQIREGSSTTIVVAALLATLDTVVTYTVSFVSGGDANGLRFMTGGSTTIGDVFYIKDVIINSEPILDVSAGNALVDSTDANAFIAPVGVDLTAYQDGRHIAHLTDSSGNVAFGWISATAPSGLAEATDVLSGWNFTSGWTTYSTTTINDADTFSVAIDGWIRKMPIVTSGSLYKGTLGSDDTNCYISNAAMTKIYVPNNTTKYFTAIDTAISLYTSSDSKQ